MDSKEIKMNVFSETGEVIVRTGDAPKVDEQTNINFEGDIEAPARYFSFIEEDVRNPERVIAEVFTTKNPRIVLTVNPASSKNKAVITGNLEIHPFITSTLMINKGNSISKQSFVNALKMHRFHFPDREANMKLVAQLEKLEMKISKELKDHDNKRGTYKYEVKQVCKAELPETFTISLPVFPGTDPASFDIELDFEIQDNKVYFYFMSPELNEYIDRVGGNLLEKAKKSFEKKIPVFYK